MTTQSFPLPVHEAQAVLDSVDDRNILRVDDRFASAVKGLNDGSTGFSDLAVLMRQILRSDDGQRRAQSTNKDAITRAWLNVPDEIGFTKGFPWRDFGLEHNSTANRSTRIRALPWFPDWLESATDEAVDEDVSSLQFVRQGANVPGDPFLELLTGGYTTYQTSGQRAAVRSAIFAPPGSTLVVNLPTGSGKTLALTAPAVMGSRAGSLSVIVVPTVSLALDQQQRYQAERGISVPTAYHGGLTPQEKIDFIERIRSGKQRIIFTNPEALVARLAEPLHGAATGGRLRLLAIDEAHIVASWGDAFRPHFHALAGLRTLLLRAARQSGHAGFRTLLASATITASTLSILHDLFGRPGPFLHVAAPEPRIEPTYWIAELSDSENRMNRLLEAIRNLPRPAVVYTTLRDKGAAQRKRVLTPRILADAARAAGFRRYAVVDGESSASERENILTAVKNSPGHPATVDLVFANSAFGLGVDIPDIRTVIHACVPESFDRYYQEVGRGGRDGRPSISVLIPTRDDSKVARDLANPKPVTVELARDRWSQLLKTSVAMNDGTQRLSLATRPSHLSDFTDFNQHWNLLTVSLLVRAGALEWDHSFETLETPEGSFGNNEGWVTVRLLRGDHQTDSFWDDQVTSARNEMVANGISALDLLNRALTRSECIGSLTAENYSISKLDLPEIGTVCQPACGGCPVCRTRGRRTPPLPLVSASITVPSIRSPLTNKLAVRGRFGQRLIITSGPTTFSFENRRRFRKQVKALIDGAGFRLIVAPEETLMDLDLARLWKGRYLEDFPVLTEPLDDFDELSAIGVPTLVIIPPGRYASPFHHGSSRTDLMTVLSVGETLTKASGRPLRELDGAYDLNDILHLL